MRFAAFCFFFILAKYAFGAEPWSIDMSHLTPPKDLKNPCRKSLSKEQLTMLKNYRNLQKLKSGYYRKYYLQYKLEQNNSLSKKEQIELRVLNTVPYFEPDKAYHAKLAYLNFEKKLSAAEKITLKLMNNGERRTKAVLHGKKIVLDQEFARRLRKKAKKSSLSKLETDELKTFDLMGFFRRPPNEDYQEHIKKNGFSLQQFKSWQREFVVYPETEKELLVHKELEVIEKKEKILLAQLKLLKKELPRNIINLEMKKIKGKRLSRAEKKEYEIMKKTNNYSYAKLANLAWKKGYQSLSDNQKKEYQFYKNGGSIPEYYKQLLKEAGQDNTAENRKRIREEKLKFAAKWGKELKLGRGPYFRELNNKCTVTKK